jgi:hypothetical protein
VEKLMALTRIFSAICLSRNSSLVMVVGIWWATELDMDGFRAGAGLRFGNGGGEQATGVHGFAEHIPQTCIELGVLEEVIEFVFVFVAGVCEAIQYDHGVFFFLDGQFQDQAYGRDAEKIPLDIVGDASDKVGLSGGQQCWLMIPAVGVPVSKQ